MARRAHKLPTELPAWRAIGAALGAFAVAVQLIMAGWLIAQAASAAEPGLQPICTHDAVPAADRDGAPPLAPHGQCQVCACLQSAKIIAPPPAAPQIVRSRARSETLSVVRVPDVHPSRIHSPYASRAPPLAA
jgi:hypothetical protein